VPFAGSSPAASASIPAWSRREDARLLPARSQVRALPPEPHAPVVENGDDAGPSTRKLRVRVPPGVLVLVRLLAVGELATPPASGAGDRRFDSCQPDLRGRGAAVLASLMSSRSWVRIPPALPLGGVAQMSRALACQARGRRFESGRPRSWWPWCNGSIRGRDPRGVGSNPVGHPFHADAEHRRAQRAVTPLPRAVVVRLHPSAPRG
jgi:hypothetical protein